MKGGGNNLSKRLRAKKARRAQVQMDRRWGSHLEALQLGSSKERWDPGQGQLVPDLAPNGPKENSRVTYGVRGGGGG